MATEYSDIFLYGKKGSIASKELKKYLDDNNVTYTDFGADHDDSVLTNLSTWVPDETLDSFPFVIYKGVNYKSDLGEVSDHFVARNVSEFVSDLLTLAVKNS